MKELLKHTDVPLRDIMSEVGYNDPTNFIRKFKKSDGLTPIQYRIAVREG
ncbi:helix-turn-helix domain-containing protein [Paenibacillus thiaminolyticus]|nr:helix-turn-helix domain-containing protein [Paenibacillus thiaminolyticus]